MCASVLMDASRSLMTYLYILLDYQRPFIHVSKNPLTVGSKCICVHQYNVTFLVFLLFHVMGLVPNNGYQEGESTAY